MVWRALDQGLCAAEPFYALASRSHTDRVIAPQIIYTQRFATESIFSHGDQSFETDSTKTSCDRPVA